MMLVCAPCNISSQDRNLFARTRYTWENLFVYSFFPHTHTNIVYSHRCKHTNAMSHNRGYLPTWDAASDPHRYGSVCNARRFNNIKYRRRCTTVIIRLLKHYMYMGYCRRVRQTAQHPNTCRVDNRTPSPPLSPQSSES